MSEPGYIYILVNPEMPQLIKVGRTSRAPEARADELYTTGVPTPFRVYWQKRVSNMVVAERLAHSELAKFRAHQNREFFRMSPGDAAERLSNLLHDYIEPSEHSFLDRLGLTNHSHSQTRSTGFRGRSISAQRSSRRVESNVITLICILILASPCILSIFSGIQAYDPQGSFTGAGHSSQRSAAFSVINAPVDPGIQVDSPKEATPEHSAPSQPRPLVQRPSLSPAERAAQNERVAKSILEAIHHAGVQHDTLRRLQRLVDTYPETRAAEEARAAIRRMEFLGRVAGPH